MTVCQYKFEKKKEKKYHHLSPFNTKLTQWWWPKIGRTISSVEGLHC